MGATNSTLLGMNAGQWGGISTGMQGLGGFGGAFAESMAAKTEGEYKKMQHETNERLAEIAAEDAIKRGEKDVEKLKKHGKQVTGAQRAALAAQGVDIDSGSAAETQMDTQLAVAEDVATIRNNAWKEAWGFRTQAENSYGQGFLAKQAGDQTSKYTLLTGGMKAFAYGGKGAVDYWKAGK